MSQCPAVDITNTPVKYEDSQYTAHTTLIIPSSPFVTGCHKTASKSQTSNLNPQRTTASKTAKRKRVLSGSNSPSSSQIENGFAVKISPNETQDTSTPDAQYQPISLDGLDSFSDETRFHNESLAQLPTRPQCRVIYKGPNRITLRRRNEAHLDACDSQSSWKGINETSPSAEESNSKPWTGDGVEDELDESIIKEGFVSKPKVTNEVGSAKTSLLPNLKNEEGVLALSQLFLVCFAERQALANVSNLTSFKPPPRVTLTDARKNTWFGDLANSLVPLRKLSRTIPHGIRGKLLLDQCRAHAVPFSRAIWLIKCVGANELRTFKRKGVSCHITIENEIRWVQVWTDQVTAFLWEVIDSRTSFDDLSYGIHLASSLFAARLLDDARFFDAVLKKYETCNDEEMPLLIGLCLMWQIEFLKSYRHAYVLACSTIKKIKNLKSTSCHPSCSTTVVKAHEILKGVLVNCPMVFRCYGVWDDDIFDVIEESLSDEKPLVLNTLRRTRLSVQQIKGVICRNQCDNASEEQKFIDILDKPNCQTDSDKLLSHINDENVGIAIHAIVVWACSEYRAQRGACAVVGHLLQEITKQQPKSKPLLMEVIMDCASKTSISVSRLARVVTKLIETALIDYRTYCHALVTSGGLSDNARGSYACDCHVSILESIPRKSLPPQLQNMAHQLIYRLGSQPREHHDSEYTLKAYMSCLPTLFPESQPSGFDVGSLHQGECTHAERMELIRVIQAAFMKLDFSAPPSAVLQPNEVNIICDILHREDDADLLEPVLSPIIRSGSCCDLMTLTALIKIFASSLIFINTFDSLRHLLIARYCAIRLRESPNKDLAAFLLSLDTMEDWANQFLESEIRLAEQNQAIAANTPVSDVIAEEQPELHNGSELITRKLKWSKVVSVSSKELEYLIDQIESQSTDTQDFIRSLTPVLECLLPKNHFFFRQSDFGPCACDPSSEAIFTLIKRLLQAHKGTCNYGRRVYDLLLSKDMRSILIHKIIHEPDKIQSFFRSLARTELSAEAIHCTHRLLMTILYDKGAFDVPLDSEPGNFIQSVLGKKFLLRLLDRVMSDNGVTSANILHFAMGLLLDLIVTKYPELRIKVREAIAKRLPMLIRNGRQQWRSILTHLPSELDLHQQFLNCAERCLLERSYSPESEDLRLFGELSKAQLLEIVRIAESRCNTTCEQSERTARIVLAIKECLDFGDEENPEKLEVVLKLTYLHRDLFMNQLTMAELVSYLCQLIAGDDISYSKNAKTIACSIVAAMILRLSRSATSDVVASLPSHIVENSDVCFLLGGKDQGNNLLIRTEGVSEPTSSITHALSAFNLAAEDPTEPPPSYHPFELRHWEVLPDSSSKVGDNDAPLGLRLFEARKTGL